MTMYCCDLFLMSSQSICQTMKIVLQQIIKHVKLKECRDKNFNVAIINLSGHRKYYRNKILGVKV